MAWTPERIAEVRSLAESGLSAAQIAIQIGGCTRNAVVGIGHRNKFNFHGGHGGGPNHTSPRSLKPRKPYFKYEAIPVPTRNVTLNELQVYMCRFPLGDPRNESFRYCGAYKVDGFSYCASHCRIAFQQPEDRTNAQP